jgi:hypothetical protein
MNIREALLLSFIKIKNTHRNRPHVEDASLSDITLKGGNSPYLCNKGMSPNPMESQSWPESNIATYPVYL